MIKKNINNEKANISIRIAEKYGLNDLKKEFEDFIEINNSYKAHILLIGGYSAGKSALLNKYIDKNVLIENQGPQTNVATELHFSENERIVANMMDGTSEIINKTDDVDVNKVRNVEYYLDSENIKMQSDYIVVDTPGFDSGIEEHNKALMQYVDRGTAFILVVDCEKGTISESALNFMNEVSNYSDDIAVIINKCDKKTPSDVYEIKTHIEDLLEVSCGRQFNVVTTSIHDENVGKKISDIIAGFSPEKLYEKNITKTLNNLVDSLVSSLILIKNCQEFETSKIDEEIQDRERIKCRLTEQVETQKKRLNTKIHNEVKEKIISKVQAELMVNSSNLAEAYNGGVELFKQNIIEIIRPILISEVESYSSVACEDFIKHIDYGSLNTIDKTEEMTEIFNNVYSKLVALTESETINVQDTDIKNDKIEGEVVTYKTITSLLAIASDAIWPPLELVIVFLPDIIRFLNTLTGNTKEQQLIDAIQKKIFPQILSKLRVELDKSLSEVENVMIDNICSNINEIIKIENEALEVAKKKKQDYIENYELFISSIEEDIVCLKG